MRVILATILFIATGAWANTGGMPSEPKDIVHAMALVIEQRLEREDVDAAYGLVKRFFDDLNKDKLLRATNAREKVRLLRFLVRQPAWHTTPGETQARILRLALEGPIVLTARLQRELIYLLARTNSLEGFGTLMAYAIAMKASPSTPIFLPSNAFPSILSSVHYRARWILKYGRLLRGIEDRPIEFPQLWMLASSWLTHFEHPDQLIQHVNKRTSLTTLKALQYLIIVHPEWSKAMSKVQRNRLEFWVNSKSCEEDLTGQES